MQVLNFYSTIFADELKRGRKTATIRLGDKSGKYRKNQAVLVTIGFQYSPRERIFEAVIDQVEVMKLADLSPRDIKHDNPEFRRHEELIKLPRTDLRPRSLARRRRHRRALLADPREPQRHDRGHQGLRRRAELAPRIRDRLAGPPSAANASVETTREIGSLAARLPIALGGPPYLLYIESERWHSPHGSAKKRRIWVRGGRRSAGRIL